MALVRCPTHKIPYNDENPRGCPACAREREGGGEAAIMKELARATRRTDAKAGSPATTGDGRSAPDTAPADMAPASTVTPQPRVPAADIGRIEEFLWQLGRPRSIVIGVLLIVVLGVLVLASSGPRFVPQPRPVPFQGEVRPLPIEPNAPVSTVFAVLGTRSPRAHPTAPQLARYSYGDDLVVDALNGRVYALTFSVPNRSWRGLRIGIPRQTVVGALALLATPEDRGVEAPANVRPTAGYMTYPSLDSLPTQTFVAGVRPPNGCYDVQVELNPQVSGLLVDGDRRHAVVGPEGTAAEWAASRIRIVSRAVRGPYAAGIVC